MGDDDGFLQGEDVLARFFARIEEGAQQVVVEQVLEALDGFGAAAHAFGPWLEGDVLIQALVAQRREAGIGEQAQPIVEPQGRAWLGSRSSS